MESNTPAESDNPKESKVCVEDLPLADRIKLAESTIPFVGIQPDWLIDSKDTVNIWCVARVQNVMNTDIKVEYDGWSFKHDAVTFIKSQ